MNERYSLLQKTALALMGRAFKSAIFDGSQGAGDYNLNGDTIRRLLQGNDGLDFRREAGDRYLNSAVMACINAACRSLPEARLVVQRRESSGEWKTVEGHPLPALLASPNGEYSGRLLMSATTLSLMDGGGAYWHKVRSSAGRIVQLWWKSHKQMRPTYPADGSAYISGFLLQLTQKQIAVPREDVVYLRYMLHPDNDRFALSPLSAADREIVLDNEGAVANAATLKNAGVPSHLLTPKDASAPKLDPNKAKGIVQWWRERFTGSNRGGVGIMEMPLDVTKLAFSPEEMMILDGRMDAEARIAGNYGIPAIVAGLRIGMEHSTYANTEQAHEAFWEEFLIPLQWLIADELGTQLLPELGDPEKERVAFDNSDVRALQPDQDAIHQRVREDYKAGLIDRATALMETARPSTPADAGIYFSSGLTTEAPKPPSKTYARRGRYKALLAATGVEANGHAAAHAADV